MTQAFIINLHPKEDSQELDCCPFAVEVDRFSERCNTLNDLSNKVCCQNKTRDLHVGVFNMITGINETKH